MIPKKIHYCWFGGKKLPVLALHCIDSWKKYLPDYEIICWNESNYDVNKILYTKEAYMKKKYAFVSDYARFDILYQYGGLYFDTDVEIIKDLTPIIQAGPFMGCEPCGAINSTMQAGRPAPGLGLAANPGLGLAANPGLELYQEILHNYSQRHFCKIDGSFDLTTVVVIISEILNRHGFLSQKNEIQECCGIKIYPPEYFCPKAPGYNEINLTKDTYTIHHYTGTWLPLSQKIFSALLCFTRTTTPNFYLLFKYLFQKIEHRTILKEYTKNERNIK